MKYLGGSSILIILAFFLMRCSGPKVIAFSGNNPNFGSYYTYRIEHPALPVDQDDAAKHAKEKVERAISAPMDAKGYEYAEVPDMVITYNLILDNKVDYRSTNTSPYDYSNRYRSPYGYYDWLERDEYTEGTLLVELREELNNKLIWQGSLDMKYNNTSSKKKKRDPVENAFETIFAEYHYIAGESKPQLAEH